MKVAVKMPMFDFIVGIMLLKVINRQKLTNIFVLIKILNTQENHFKTLCSSPLLQFKLFSLSEKSDGKGFIF